jgi:hypothetical protein
MLAVISSVKQMSRAVFRGSQVESSYCRHVRIYVVLSYGLADT